MRAVILAAGIASRLRPLTDNTPKCLLKAGKKSILELTLDNLIENDIKDIVVVTGYLEQQIRNFISAYYPKLNVTYIHNELYSSTNNIYSLWLAKGSILDNEMLLLDSDIIFDKQIVNRLLTSGYDNCLALKIHNVKDEEIKVRIDGSSRVLEIGKKVSLKEAIGESIGIEKFGVDTVRKLFDILDRIIQVEKNVNLFYEAAFQELADTNTDIFTVDVSDAFCMEIDTAADLEEAVKYF